MATRTRLPSRPATPDQSGSGPSRLQEPSNPVESRIRQDLALTFDDVLLVPRHSLTHPKDVSVVSRFTRGIELRIPLASAAMDTVTESEMAIAMARAGGIGVLHKNMSIDRQAAEGDRVKRSESGMILKPITLRPSDTVREATALMHRFHISGVPIVDEEERLVGIITNRDLQFERNIDRPLRDAMTADGLITAREGTTLDEAEKILGEHRIEKLPVVDAAGVLRGLITIKDIHKRRQYPDANKDRFGRLRVAAAIGAGGDFINRARALIDAGVDALIIDTAHGHADAVLDATSKVREAFSDIQLIAGNIATRHAAAAPGAVHRADGRPAEAPAAGRGTRKRRSANAGPRPRRQLARSLRSSRRSGVRHAFGSERRSSARPRRAHAAGAAGPDGACGSERVCGVSRPPSGVNRRKLLSPRRQGKSPEIESSEIRDSELQNSEFFLSSLASWRLGERYFLSLHSSPRSWADVSLFSGLRPNKRPVSAATMTHQKPKPTMARFSIGKSESGER